LVDTHEHWHHVATKYFAVSKRLGLPTFFLTFTITPHSPDYRILKKDGGVLADQAMGAIIFKATLFAVMKFIHKRGFWEQFLCMENRLSKRTPPTRPYRVLE
jgi:hypothetical protein